MKRRILYIVMIITVALGLLMIKLKGFNYATLYSDHQRIEIVLGNEYDIKDINKIAKESLKGSPVVRKATLFNTSISIDAKNITDEEITNLFNKLNEKYGKNYNIKDMKKFDILTELNATSISDMGDTEISELITKIKEQYNLDYTKEELQNTSSSVRMYNVARARVFDLVKGFILPMAISLAIIALYYSIRYKKLYKNAWILKPLKLIFEMILNQAFIIAIIAIARIPVSYYVSTILIVVWLLQLISETLKSEIELKKIKAEE